jgi:transposase-like protein
MNKIMGKFSPEVCTRAVRMVLDHESDYTSRWAAIVSVADKIGCTVQTLREWMKKAEVDWFNHRRLLGSGPLKSTFAV